MNLPSRHIIILLILSLTALLGYQVYWLYGLYRSTIKTKEEQIEMALQKADDTEMIERVRAQVQTLTQVSDRTDSFSIDKNVSKSISGTIISADNNSGDDNEKASFSFPASISQKMSDYYLRRGLHSYVDSLAEVNFTKLDSLLMIMLEESDLNVPHRLQMLSGGTVIATISSSGYTPSARANDYVLSYGQSLADKYQLTLEPLTIPTLREMSSIITASLILFFILAFSFWFLIHTMLKQKSLEEMKSDFTNNITHELKTPVAVAYAANDALLNFDAGNDPEKRREYLEISQVQLEKLEGMIEQILSMSMESRKTFELRRETIELEPLLQKLSEQHRLSAGKPCDIHIDVEKGLVLDADRFHLSNILSNLIDNAIKYSGSSVRIGITAKATDEGTEIRVWDNGIGIATDKQKHIFDKFYRVPTGNVHDVKGYGLGLYYAKTMAEKHGGTLSVTSTPGKGSEFILTL
ncbi:MAG: HAMP domain-containing histidine kinase [Bacteroidales bacterium]|nr:HAMP domain-containing histidine kinase [Bacteroidales bacterium]